MTREICRWIMGMTFVYFHLGSHPFYHPEAFLFYLFPKIQEMQRQKSALYFHVPFFSKQSGGHHSLLGKVPSVCFLALAIGKRFRIGLGFGHKILAQT